MSQIDAAAIPPDARPGDANPADDSAPRAWPRGAFMLLFVVLASLAQNLLTAIAVLQFLWLLFARAPNPFLKRFGAALGAWLEAVARYQSCDSEARPFPFADWPQPAPRRA